MKQIAIQSKNRTFFALVDDEDYPLLSRHKWYILFSGKRKRPYAFTRFYTEHDTKNGKTFLMHHMIMGTSSSIDHWNQNSLDNQKENLRAATYQQNGWNKGKAKACRHGKPSSQYKGVSKYTNTKGETLWRVIIKLTKKDETPAKYLRINNFKTEEDAAKAYDREIVKLRGKWAVTNVLKNNNII